MEETQEVKLTRHQRYYALHRADKLSKENEKYNTNPEVIARREERERKRIAREAEQEVKRQEKEIKRKKALEISLAIHKKNTRTPPDGIPPA
jgi:hypothetical protein